MKHFKNTAGEIYAFALDGSQDGLITADMTAIGDADLAALLAPQLTDDELIARVTVAIQSRLDEFAQERGYDNMLSACTYATSGVPKFAAEGQYCVQARDATWSVAYGILADVQAGTRSMPSVNEVMAEMPALEWPQ